MRRIKQLTARRAATITKPGKYGDGLGLWLNVRPSGTRTWVFRFMRQGKAREMGLGPLHTISLAEARERALLARKQLIDGIDPIEARKEKTKAIQLAKASALTFKESSKRCIETHKITWKNQRHANQWTTTLETYVWSVFGDLPVQSIDTRLVMKTLKPIWTSKPETASRIRGRIERILDWARANGYREGENPARWRGHLDQLLPAHSLIHEVKHFAALSFEEIPDFMKALRRCDGISARALEFAILTACRSGEVRKANWLEMDLVNKVWTIPADRMKTGKTHRISLSFRALEVLKEMLKHGTEDFVFPGKKIGSPLSNMTLIKVLHRMGRKDITVHGFRSTFRDWTSEQTTYSRDVAEMALAHAIGNKVEAAYRRGDLLEKRRRLMADWATYCERPSEKGTVVSIGKSQK